MKFGAPLGVGLPDLRHLVHRTERLPDQQLLTAYFDTPDGRLWNQGITLRHRVTQGDSGGKWTLKLPAAAEGATLNRTEVSWEGPRHEIPRGASAIVQGLVREQRLQQLVELQSTRQRLLLHDAADHTLAEIDDDTVTVKGGPRDGLRFRQVELELHDADAKVVRKVTARLKGVGLSPETTPKLERAMEFPVSLATEPHLGPNSSLGDVVTAVLTQGLTRLLEHDWRLRAAVGDAAPEDIHQARVATRRLRSDLRTFDVVLDPVWVSHVRVDLKWLGSALGEVRDADVLAGQLAGAPAEIGVRLASQRAEAAKRVAAVLADDRYLLLLNHLHAATNRPPFVLGEGGIRQEDRAQEFFPPLSAPDGVPYAVRSARLDTIRRTNACTTFGSRRSNSATRQRRRRRSWGRRLGGLRRRPKTSRRSSASTTMPSPPNRGSEGRQKAASPPPAPSRPDGLRLSSNVFSASFGNVGVARWRRWLGRSAVVG